MKPLSEVFGLDSMIGYDIYGGPFFKGGGGVVHWKNVLIVEE